MAILSGVGAFFAGRASLSFPDRLLASADGKAVGTWRTGRLTEAELEELIAAEPPLARLRVQDAAGREAYARKVVESRLVAEEAIRRGMLARAPLKQALVERLAEALKEKEFSPEVLRARMSEVDLKKLFEEHAHRFSRPEKVRLAHLWLEAPEAAPGRSTKRAKAEELLKSIRRKQRTDSMEFARSAAMYSDEAESRSRAGDLGYLTREQLAARYGAALAEAAWLLKSPGDMTEVLEAPDGFHLLQLAARLPASTARFEEVKGALAAELLERRQREELEAFTQGLIASARVQLSTAAQ